MGGWEGGGAETMILRQLIPAINCINNLMIKWVQGQIVGEHHISFLE